MVWFDSVRDVGCVGGSFTSSVVVVVFVSAAHEGQSVRTDRVNQGWVGVFRLRGEMSSP